MNCNDLGIYIHIPFCTKRCLYCDYTSFTNLELIEKYFDTLKKEIILKSRESKSFKIKTIYLGGGTPSIIKTDLIEDIFFTLLNNYDINSLEEFTIEVNPESVREDKLSFYKSIGINRISIGFQSTTNEILKKVGRIHRFEEEIRAFSLLKKYFDNINVDFILGLPGENTNTVAKNLEFIQNFQPSHISYYLFDASHDTPLKFLLNDGKMYLPDEDFLAGQLDLIDNFLKNINYKHYEISSWALLSKESMHNKLYWHNLNYQGFGISAGGHVNNFRYVNTSSINNYIKYINEGVFPYEYQNSNDSFHELIETLFMGLRLLDGINYVSLVNRFGKTLT
ncbi:MAG: radical SAM family heme chaperone HemW, partial [Defluviitoga tunisiensis]